MTRPYTYHFLFKPFVYITSLIMGTYLVLWIEKLKPSDLIPHNGLFQKEVIVEPAPFYPMRKAGMGILKPEETNYAKAAWKYIENNTIEENGLVRCAEGYDQISVKDMGDYGMALIAAYETGVIKYEDFNCRLVQFIQTVSALKLNSAKLPFYIYNITTLEPVPGDQSLLWNANDIGRFLAFVNKIVLSYPEYQSQAKSIINRWNLNAMMDLGTLFSGALDKNNNIQKICNTRMGYEEYASKGLIRAGFDATEALRYNDYLKFITIDDIKVGIDAREESFKPQNCYLTSDAYLYDGIEYGFDVTSRELAWRLYNVQKTEGNKSNKSIALSEDFIDKKPYYVVNALYADHHTWTCFDKKGKDEDELKTISTKAAFGWHILYKDDYSYKLMRTIEPLCNPEKGWYSGIYQKTGKENKALSLATNGFILEALDYKKNGVLLKL